MGKNEKSTNVRTIILFRLDGLGDLHSGVSRGKVQVSSGQVAFPPAGCYTLTFHFLESMQAFKFYVEIVWKHQPSSIEICQDIYFISTRETSSVLFDNSTINLELVANSRKTN